MTTTDASKHRPLRIVDDEATTSICISDGDVYIARACYIYAGDTEAKRESLESVRRLVNAYNEAPALRSEIDRLRAEVERLNVLISTEQGCRQDAEEDCVAFAGLVNHYAPDDLVEVEVLVGEDLDARPAVEMCRLVYTGRFDGVSMKSYPMAEENALRMSVALHDVGVRDVRLIRVHRKTTP